MIVTNILIFIIKIIENKTTWLLERDCLVKINKAVMNEFKIGSIKNVTLAFYCVIQVASNTVIK